MSNKEHTKCGTPECCTECLPTQLDLFAEKKDAKDTNQKPLSFDGGAKSSLSYNRKREWPYMKKKLGI